MRGKGGGRGVTESSDIQKNGAHRWCKGIQVVPPRDLGGPGKFLTRRSVQALCVVPTPTPEKSQHRQNQAFNPVTDLAGKLQASPPASVEQVIQGLQQQIIQLQVQSQRQSMNLEIHTFEGHTSQEHKRWARTARIVYQGNKYTLAQTIAATLSSVSGFATDFTSTLPTDPGQYASVEDFFSRLQSLFGTPAFTEDTRAHFLVRAQGPKQGTTDARSSLPVMTGE